MRIIQIVIIAFLLALSSISFATDYKYPFSDPFKATVYGTPPDMVYPITEAAPIELRSIRIPGRRVPEIFSHDSEMYYSTALQKEPAPLIFIIAGTGAEHKSAKMVFLTNVLYKAGFSVVALSSPTHMNFIVSISEHAVPGYVPYDVDDLYRVMRWVKKDLADEVAVTDYFVTGYSLGALHAAFLAYKDSEIGEFNFKKVVMINPPVSLYHSVRRLDSWLNPDSLDGKLPRYEIQRIINLFSNYYKSQDITDLDDDFLYDMITQAKLTGSDLRVLIGTDFRASSASMIFASDVCLRAEYIVPPGAYPLTIGTPLMKYAESVFDIDFMDYLDEYLLPYLQYRQPEMNRYDFIQQCSLYAIRSFLQQSENIVLLGNRDDIILNENDINFIQSVFGQRAFLYPTGGHCGNLMYTPFVERLVSMVSVPEAVEGVQ